jgi:hypothetical protein
MKNHTPDTKPLDNQRYSVVRMRNRVESKPHIKAAGRNERAPQDPTESEKELRKLEELRSHFLSLASDKYQYPYRPSEIGNTGAPLISRLLNPQTIKQAVRGILKSVIF